MVRRAIIGLVCFWGVVVCVGCNAKPIAYVAEPVFNFGVAFEGDVVEHAFLIKNQGDSPLEILDVRTSCGCTATKLSGTTVQPGATIRLSASFDSDGFGGQQTSKTVTVETNDPENRVIILRLEGTVASTDPRLVRAEDVPALTLIVDVRAAEAYSEGHLLGAVNLAAEVSSDWIPLIPSDLPILLYDQSGESALGVAEGMLRAGFLNVKVLLGGFDEWVRAYGERLVVTFATVFVPNR